MDHADELGKSARLTQESLEKRIEALAAMEARVLAAVQGIHAAVKNLEGERARLQAVGPGLQQNAAWAMRETLREQSGEIEGHMRSGMAEPLRDIRQAASHVLSNVKETRWLIIAAYITLGMVLGLALGYLPVRSTSMPWSGTSIRSTATSPASSPNRLQLRCLYRPSKTRSMGGGERLVDLPRKRLERRRRPTNPQPRRR